MLEGIMSHEFDGLDATEKAGIEAALNTPITGIGWGCCARTASGHTAAAPPRSVTNSRRRMSDMRACSPRFVPTKALAVRLVRRHPGYHGADGRSLGNT